MVRARSDAVVCLCPALPRFVAGVAFTLSLMPQPVVAQQLVRGLLVDEVTGAAVVGAFIRVGGLSQRSIVGAISDVNGRFSVHTPVEDSILVSVERVGFAPHRATLFVRTDTVHVISLPGIPMVLDPIVVQTERACNGTMSEATVRTWQNISTALRIAAWSAEVGAVQYSAIQYARRYANAGQVLVRQDSQLVSLTRRGSPYFGSPVDSLLDFGFVRVDTLDSAVSWFGPDMTTILADRFQEEYCFMEPSQERKGLRGVRFRPIAVPRSVGIDGVLWVDAANGELRELQFTYVSSPFVQQMDGGGTLEFTRLATNHWIVSRWRLRVPNFLETREGDGVRLYPFGEHEIDRQVLEARSADGTLLWQRVRD